MSNCHTLKHRLTKSHWLIRGVIADPGSVRWSISKEQGVIRAPAALAEVNFDQRFWNQDQSIRRARGEGHCLNDDLKLLISPAVIDSPVSSKIGRLPKSAYLVAPRRESGFFLLQERRLPEDRADSAAEKRDCGFRRLRPKTRGQSLTGTGKMPENKASFSVWLLVDSNITPFRRVSNRSSVRWLML
jgi:hypothetical protein